MSSTVQPVCKEPVVIDLTSSDADEATETADRVAGRRPKARLQQGASGDSNFYSVASCLAYGPSVHDWFLGFDSKLQGIPRRHNIDTDSNVLPRGTQQTLAAPVGNGDRASHTLILPGRRVAVSRVRACRSPFNYRTCALLLCLLVQFVVSILYVEGSIWKMESAERGAKYAVIRGMGSLDVRVPTFTSYDTFSIVCAMVGFSATIMQSIYLFIIFQLFSTVHLILYVPNAPSLASVLRLLPTVLGLALSYLEYERLSCGILIHEHIE